MLTSRNTAKKQAAIPPESLATERRQRQPSDSAAVHGNLVAPPNRVVEATTPGGENDTTVASYQPQTPAHVSPNICLTGRTRLSYLRKRRSFLLSHRRLLTGVRNFAAPRNPAARHDPLRARRPSSRRRPVRHRHHRHPPLPDGHTGSPALLLESVPDRRGIGRVVSRRAGRRHLPR
jgi:hypothetical protein